MIKAPKIIATPKPFKKSAALSGIYINVLANKGKLMQRAPNNKSNKLCFFISVSILCKLTINDLGVTSYIDEWIIIID